MDILVAVLVCLLSTFVFWTMSSPDGWDKRYLLPYEYEDRIKGSMITTIILSGVVYIAALIIVLSIRGKL